MKYFFFIVLELLVCSIAFGQYDTVIRSLIDIPSNSPKKLNGIFKKRTEVHSGERIEYYKFSKSKIDFCYYPKQANVSCGYFKLFGKVFVTNDRPGFNPSCDLDYGSFELFGFILNNKNYLILNAIRYGSGTTTSFVYCNLFDITNKDDINYCLLSSIYGSGLSFGDYNNDNKIDFLEIVREKDSKSADSFTLLMKTYDDTRKNFYLIENKYINFVRHFKSDDSFEILRSDSRW
ncbi:hypothetical protein [Flavihumibacter profundi]|uniref:hypothetical protein n=1 Tax=Flavihumibacter profundi TaxID=2716883 RepID=UPI001CC3CCF7|nr:hypothetical protein [Flavihumibacter profundi]MBZ5858571.1 hypothetical protein [Flavihumibacter profundi]